ncbi:MAG: nitrous oxide reductase accessory protein NosL, partial [Giesbergeria sp.]
MKSPALSSRRTWLTLGLAALAVSALPGASAWMARKAVPEPESDFCLVAPPTPYDPASGLALHAARAVPKDARCPVCGMYPARAPDWAAQLIFSNGDAQFFDSPLSLFMYLGDVARYSPGRSADDVAAQFVTDASGPSRRWIDAKSAFYVVDSSARGPMRAGNLPAFATQQAARQFAEQRGG